MEKNCSVGWLQHSSAVTFLRACHNQSEVLVSGPFPARDCDTQVKQLDERHGVNLAIDRLLAWLFHLVLLFFGKAG
jgi:hypothetical protein